MPRTKLGRIALGVALLVGGVFGFLPIVGFWMIPLGLYVLSHDFARVRRWRRQLLVRHGRRFAPQVKRLRALRARFGL